MELLTKLKEELIIEEEHEKTSFWASETQKDKFDIYCRWLNIPQTNPIEAEKMIVFSAGKMMEMALVEKIRKLGILIHPQEEDDSQLAFRIEREGVPVSGKLDAVIQDGTGQAVVEVKTMYGNYQSYELANGSPRESYLEQLAIYLDATGLTKGYLIYLDRGTGEMFEFVLRKTGGLVYECNSENNKGYAKKIIIDLDKIYKRFATIYNEYILPNVEPDSDFIYKIPPAQVDWHSQPSTQISKARNNKKVIGNSWSIAYSCWKDLIVTKEAAKHGKTLEDYLGYSTEELDIIKELTKGYSNWPK